MLIVRDVHFGKAARGTSVYRFRNFDQDPAYRSPAANGKDFSAALLRMLIRPTVVKKPVISKVLLKRNQRIGFLKQLRRMNIYSASLFPGLDGFARLQASNLEVSVADQVEATKLKAIKAIRRYREMIPR